MRSCVIIPARFASTRYPGKPLVKLLGKPMVLWVAELAARAVGTEHVYVATESDDIREAVEAAGFRTLMTSEAALTGTDRLAEAARQVDYDIYINVQGDEPLVDPADIIRCRDAKIVSPDAIVNGFTWLGDEEDPANVNIPKVVANEAGTMLYMSRAPIPGAKTPASSPRRYRKQVCIYCFTRSELEDFAGYGRKSELEACEDIEILRFAELGYAIRMVETQPGSLAVDEPGDVAAVEAALRRQSGR